MGGSTPLFRGVARQKQCLIIRSEKKFGAVRWMEKNVPQDEELPRFAAESVEYDDATGNYVGPYEIVGGTGVLEGATGSGTLIIVPGSGGGSFTMSGTID
jgi:hypothetical protein